MARYVSAVEKALRGILDSPDATRSEKIGACDVLERMALRLENRRVRQYEIRQRELVKMPEWVRDEEGQ